MMQHTRAARALALAAALASSAGCAAGAGSEHHSLSARYFESDSTAILRAASQALTSYGRLEASDARAGTVSGHVGPYQVRITVPPGTRSLEIQCDVDGAWSAGAAKARAEGDPTTVRITKEGLTARRCAEDLQSEIEKRF